MNDTFHCMLCCEKCEAKPERCHLCDDCHRQASKTVEMVREGTARAAIKEQHGTIRTIEGFDAPTLIEFRIVDGLHSHGDDAEQLKAVLMDVLDIVEAMHGRIW